MSAHANTDVVQPTSFAFSPENLEKAKKIIARYPEGRQRSAHRREAHVHHQRRQACRQHRRRFAPELEREEL